MQAKKPCETCFLRQQLCPWKECQHYLLHEKKGSCVMHLCNSWLQNSPVISNCIPAKPEAHVVWTELQLV